MAEVTINTIRDGIIAIMDANFPGAVASGEEIKEGLQEPYFFVKLLQGGQEQELGRRYRRSHSFDIHYFGLDNRDMHEAAEKLYDVMESISVGADRYRGTGMTHEIVDRVLHFFVDYNFHVWRQAPPETAMGQLDHGGGLKP